VARAALGCGVEHQRDRGEVLVGVGGHGVWGGLSESERVEIVRARDRTPRVQDALPDALRRCTIRTQ
jgi:hypothetical protein